MPSNYHGGAKRYHPSEGSSFQSTHLSGVEYPTWGRKDLQSNGGWLSRFLSWRSKTSVRKQSDSGRMSVGRLAIIVMTLIIALLWWNPFYIGSFLLHPQLLFTVQKASEERIDEALPRIPLSARLQKTNF